MQQPAEPGPHNGYSTGIGGLNVFNIFLLNVCVEPICTAFRW